MPMASGASRIQVNSYVSPGIGSVLLRDLSGPMLNKLYAKLLKSGCRRVAEGGAAGLSPTSVHLVHVTIHRMLKDAVRWNLLPRNMADLAGPPRPRKPGEETMTVWSPEQLRTFLESVDSDRLQALWLLLITTGLRRGEVAGLRCPIRPRCWSPAGQPGPGGRRSRGALKSHEARQATERLKWGPAYKGTELIFTWEDGRPLHPNVISRTFARAAEKAELPVIRPHDLRHSYASAALEAGVSIKVVSEHLGHSSISNTGDIYSHVRAEVDQAAADKVAGVILGAGA